MNTDKGIHETNMDRIETAYLRKLDSNTQITDKNKLNTQRNKQYDLKRINNREIIKTKKITWLPKVQTHIDHNMKWQKCALVFT